MTKVAALDSTAQNSERRRHGGPESRCDLVEQFISHYLRQCGYLGAKGRVHSLKCATSLPRERDGGGRDARIHRWCEKKLNRGWHRWPTHIRCTHRFFDVTEESRVKRTRMKKARKEERKRRRAKVKEAKEKWKKKSPN